MRSGEGKIVPSITLDTHHRRFAGPEGVLCERGARPETHPTPQTNHPGVAVTLLENASGPATKMFAFDGDGMLTQMAPQIYSGQARVIEVEGVQGLIRTIEQLPPNQALTYGVPPVREATILTQDELRRSDCNDAIARTREHFRFAVGRPGVLMLDHDPRPGYPRLDWREVDQILCDCVPQWREVERAWRPSASAYIYDSNGKELIGRGGWRCYAIVDDGSYIPDVGASVYQRLWDAGHGYIVVSKSGRALDRSLIDAAVWQPERLDFAAPPVLAAGLERRAPPSEILPGEPILAGAALACKLPMSDWRATSSALKKARTAAHGQIAGARNTYVDARVTELRARFPQTAATRLAAVVTRAVEQLHLGGEFLLRSADGVRVTVAEILLAADEWHGTRFADPLEPDYRGDTRIAYASLRPSAGAPFIYSHAHGGTRYSLSCESTEIRLVRGEQPHAVDAAMDLLRSRGEVFERGSEIVRLADGCIVPASDEWLTDYFGRHVRFVAIRERAGVNVDERRDAPPWLARRINAKVGERGLRELRAVITAPTMRSDGSVLETPGYDEATGLLLQAGTWPHIPEDPSHAALTEAVTTLWRPFAEFPFVDETSRSVMLATLLTAMVRQSLPLAPGISFDAPDAATGKTLLGRCLLVLCGMAPTVIPECRGDEEIRKRLLSALRAGRPGFLFDNIRGEFGSAAIEALLTAENYCDRVLGASEMITLPTAALVIFSGNNFRPAGDLWRRILTARIDAKTDAPERRSFALDPLAHCRKYRQEIVAAGLTLLRGFVAAGSPRSTPDSLASFEAWDSRVRQCVIWTGTQGFMPTGVTVGDSAKAIDNAKAEEPERRKLSALLAAVDTILQDGRWCVADLVKKSDPAVGSLHGREMTCSPAAMLREALDEIAGGRGAINSRVLGRWIEKQADRRCAGLRLERAGGRAGVAYWRVRR